MTEVPEHLPDIAGPREAFAPYNFIPLPAKAVAAEIVQPSQRVVVEKGKKDDSHPVKADYLVRHDQYFADRHTGTITCRLTTASPLYVRCGLSAAEFETAINEVENQHGSSTTQTTPTKHKPDFFASPGQLAVIPGSSLRGLLRHLVEIVSHSKIDLVTRKHLFFRSVDTTNLGQYYQSLLRNNVSGGILDYDDDGGTIKQTQYYKIPHKRLNDFIPNILNEKGIIRFPNNFQYKDIWVIIEDSTVNQLSIEPQNDTQWLPAILVLTGSLPGKKDHEFVFLKPTNQEGIPISKELLQQFHDDDQLTQWQKRAFLKGKDRKHAGWLRTKDQPIFFILDHSKPQQVSFFGRAGMFRLPYTHSPYDLIPPHLRTGNAAAPLVDLTEALFGFVHRGQANAADQITSYASRLRFSDAKLVNQQLTDSELWDTEITPPILASPKPTTFQHYLTQDASDRQELHHYGNNPNETTIRGYKHYWHQGEFAAATRHKPDSNADSTQTTRMRPVKAGVEFEFEIAFENLSDVELGVLIYVLELAMDSGYRLKLGMGKPFGFGSIAIDYAISISDRQARYKQLFSQNNWLRAENDLDRQTLLRKRQAFCDYVLQASGEQERGVSKFNQIPRIQQLLAMLEWDVTRFKQTEPRPWAETVRYMQIERLVGGSKQNEYFNRPVLPTPMRVINRRLLMPKKPEKPIKIGNDLWGKLVHQVSNTIWLVQLDNRDLEYKAAVSSLINPRDMRIGKRVLIRIKSVDLNSVQEIRKIQ